jgi:two-component system, chemotaxis family, protein-glutamate methylesterase/glutaminase
MPPESETFGRSPDVIRVLIADDQSFMRIALRRILEAEKDICVIGEARNGVEAVQMARDLKPDAVTLDVEMPEMDGLQACEEIASSVKPRPIVIMVSAHTQAGADAAVKALRCGAADFVSKSSGFAKMDLAHIDSELRRKLRALVKPSPLRAYEKAAPRAKAEAASWYPNIIAVAASTGGPQALTTLFKNLTSVSAPIVVAQHMPELFTASLAQALSYDTGHDVKEGTDRLALAPSTVTIVPGGSDGVVAPCRSGGYELRLVKTDSNVHPSANALLESAALVASAPAGIILTGMGADGAKGALALRRKGAPVLVQEPATCIVSGMPDSALNIASGCAVMTIAKIANRIDAWSSREAAALTSKPPNVRPVP